MGTRDVGKLTHDVASGIGLDWRIYWPSVGTWARYDLHHPISTFPGANPWPGATLWPWHQQPTENHPDAWSIHPVASEYTFLAAGRQRGRRLEPLPFSFLTEMPLPHWESAPGPFRARAAWLMLPFVTGKLSKIGLNPCQAPSWTWCSMTLNILLDKPEA